MIKQIKEQQANNVNDSCADCGSFVDIGAVVEADDTVLQLSFSGSDALLKANTLQEVALQRFPETKVTVTQHNDQYDLVLAFEFSVEKMIFQLENSL